MKVIVYGLEVMWQRLIRWASLKQRRHLRSGVNGQKNEGLLSFNTISIGIVILFSLAVILQLGISFINLPKNLQLQQRCRMSRMWPSYMRYHAPSPVGLDAKYKLYLYREAPPGSTPPPPTGRPALFVPGNAGSYGQVRSVASSSHHLFERGEGIDSVKGEVDWWTVDFNEDFSAFHGETMREQAVYLNDVIAFLQFSIYKNSTKVPILAHSMGGIVARLTTLQNNHRQGSVETVITLSSPHAYPPVPMETGLEDIYQEIEKAAGDVSNDILLISLSGGILDDQLSSEASSLRLARLWKPEASLSAFTSGLAALWSGVDHLAMMWCDQLRERIARGVLRIEGGESSLSERREAWRRVLGIARSQEIKHSTLTIEKTSFQLSELVADRQARQNVQSELLNIPEKEITGFELLTKHPVGMDKSFGPPIDQEAKVRVALCDSAEKCRWILPSAYDLIPPSRGKDRLSKNGIFPTFPISDNRYELPENGFHFLTITKDDLVRHATASILVDEYHREGSSDRGFVYAQGPLSVQEHSSSRNFLIRGSHRQPSTVNIIRDMDSTLLAYTLELLPTTNTFQSCKDWVDSAPMLHVESLSTGDQQWYPAVNSGESLKLMLHGSSPFMPPSRGQNRGMKFNLMQNDCGEIDSISINVDWKTSAGLILSRYRTSVVALPLTIILLLSSIVWEQWDHGAPFAATTSALSMHLPFVLPLLLLVSFAASILQRIAFLRFGVDDYTLITNLTYGIPASPILHSVLLAIFFIPTSYGVVALMAALLNVIVKALSIMGKKILISEQNTSKGPMTKADFAKGAVVFSLLGLAVYFFLPIQFVFLVLFVVQLINTVKATVIDIHSDGRSKEHSAAIVNQQVLLLNIFFWLLPLNAPVLLIWTRNLWNGWYGTLGKSDHNILKISGFLFVNYISVSAEGFPRMRSKAASFLVAVLFLRGAILGILYGIRYTSDLFGATNVAFLCLAATTLYERRKEIPVWSKEEEVNREEQKTLFDAEDDQPAVHHSTLPQSILNGEENALPPSLKASLKDNEAVQGYQIESVEEGKKNRNGKPSVLDELLQDYLTTLDEYMKAQNLSSDAISRGLFQLSKARMQLGSPYLTSNWDARMKASVGVEINGDRVSLSKLNYADSEEMNDIAGESDAATEKGSSALRRRKGKTDEKSKATVEEEKEDEKGEKKKKKPAAPYDPLYQYSGLPPQTLRNAQTQFNSLLNLIIGSAGGTEGLINTKAKLLQLEQAIRKERERLDTGNEQSV